MVNNLTLLPGADGLALEAAAAANHTELFCRNAIARGGEVREVDGFVCTYDGEDHQSMVAFPDLAEDTADAVLDRMMEWYGQRPGKGIGYWSLGNCRPGDLGRRLLARGWQDGWKPCWMAVELRRIGEAGEHGEAGDRGRIGAPDDGDRLIVLKDNRISLVHIPDLPYTGRNGAISPELFVQEGQAHQFIAKMYDQVVGHCSLFLGTGAGGVAGIYDVGVIPRARLQGVGRAMVKAACLLAKEKGYHYATLNATGRRMYEALGFQWISNGHTWWWFPRSV